MPCHLATITTISALALLARGQRLTPKPMGAILKISLHQGGLRTAGSTRDIKALDIRRVTRRQLILGTMAAGAALLLALVPRVRGGRGCRLASLGMILRADWGAAEPNLSASGEYGRFDAATNPEGWFVYPKPLAELLNTVVVHHSALPLSDGPLEIQRLHMARRGFADIAYHFVIAASGQLYEGRPLNVRGAHTGGHNTGTVGIVLLGNFEVMQPTAAQMQTLQATIRCLVDQYGITHLAGHQDFQPGETLCPGMNLTPRLPALAAELGLVFGTGGYVAPHFEG